MADAITGSITVSSNTYIANGIIYTDATYDATQETLTGGTAAYELTGGTAVSITGGTSAFNATGKKIYLAVYGSKDSKVIFTGNNVTTSSNGGAAIGITDIVYMTFDGAEVNDLNNATIVFSNNSYTRNGTTSTSRGGGAISVTTASSTLTMNYVKLDSNTSSYHGGAIYLNKINQATLNNVLFSNNEATGESANGGAIHLVSGKLSLTDVAFQDNTAGQYGGALYINAGTSSMTLSNVTFSGNKSKRDQDDTYYVGGALYINAGTVTIEGLVNLLTETDTIYVKNGGVLQVDVSKFSGPIAEVVKTGGAFTGDSGTTSWLVNGAISLTADVAGSVQDKYGYAFTTEAHTAAAIVTADHAHGIVDANGTVYFGGAFASLDDAFASTQYNNVAIDNLTVNEELRVDNKYLIITGSCTVSASLTTEKSITVTGADFTFDNSETITVDGNYTAAAALNFTGSGSVTFSGLDFAGSTTALSITVGSVTDPLTVATGLSNVSAVSVKVGDAEAQSVTVGGIFAVGDTKYKLTNDASDLVLSVVPGELVIDTAVTTDEKGNYTNTTGALEVTVKAGAEIANNLYAAVSGTDAKLTVTGGNIKNIFAGAKFEADATTGNITATVGGEDITTTRIYGGNAVLGGTVETVNTTLTISGALIAKDLSTGVWCYGAGIAASTETTSGTLKINGTSTVKVEAHGDVGSVVGGGRAQGTGSLDVNATSVTIGSSATVTNAIGGAYNSGKGRVSVGTAEMSISSQNVTTVFGGNFIAPVSDNVSSDDNSITKVNLTLNGAKASNAIFGGNYMKAGSATIGTVTININGADSACGIYGGGFIVGAASETIGEVNITVSGKVEGNIFAGACVSGEGGSSTVEKATITISGDVTGNVYAGGYSVNGTAAVGACTITFDGFSAFNGKVCATSAGSVTTAAPKATVVFDKYVGDFGGAFAGTFDVIEFTADSSVNFKGSDNIIFDGLKTNAVQITGMDTVTYSADADHVLFNLADSCDFDINRISVDGATLQSGISESSFTYFWNESTQEFGYAGAEAIKSYTTDSSYKLYQLTIA